MTYYTAAITLILVMDPLGNIPVFLSLLKRYDPKTQARIITRETCIAFLILTLFLFSGKFIMGGLHLTPEALRVSGGIILFIIALRLIFPQDKTLSKEEEEDEPFIVPMAIPLIAGPSALATVVLFATRNPGYLWNEFIAVMIASAVFLVLMLLSRYLMRILGRRGLKALERLMGMILTTVAVQMFLGGIKAYMALA